MFVAGALPGDTVRAAITKSKRNFAEARVVELLRPSTDRIPDRCDHGGEPCPGAPWQGLPYEQQLRHKSDRVGDALRRIGGLDGFELEAIEPAAEQWRYRNKLEYSFGEHDGELVLGFHARGRWDEVVDVEDCLLASSEQQRRAATSCARGLAPAACPPTTGAAAPARSATWWFARVVAPGSSRPASSPRPPRSRSRPSTCTPSSRAPAAEPTAPPARSASSTCDERLRGLSFRISHGAFFQTNTEMAEHLYGIATEMAGLGGTERLFDLYCGIGTLALTMAGSAGEVWGLEVVPEAIVDAEENARTQRHRERPVPRRRRPHRDQAAARGGRAARRRRRRPAAGGAVRRRSCGA